MATKIKDLSDCTCGRDYWQYLTEHDITPEKIGSYYEFYDPESGEIVHFPDSDRTLPKETCNAINAAFIKAGLVLAGLLALAWVVL